MLKLVQEVKAVTDEAASSFWPLTTPPSEQVLVFFDLLTPKEKRQQRDSLRLEERAWWMPDVRLHPAATAPALTPTQTTHQTSGARTGVQPATRSEPRSSAEPPDHRRVRWLAYKVLLLCSGVSSQCFLFLLHFFHSHLICDWEKYCAVLLVSVCLASEERKWEKSFTLSLRVLRSRPVKYITRRQAKDLNEPINPIANNRRGWRSDD